MRVHHLELESLKERYTEMSNDTFNVMVKHRGHTLIEYPRPSSGQVKTGKVLDANETIIGQSVQMESVAGVFSRGGAANGDVFFTSDFWHHNACSIPYMAMLNNLDIQFFAWAHAGSYTTGDFMQPAVQWGAHLFELAFLTMYTGIFVGTEYHKNKILDERVPENLRKEYAKKIFVTGNLFSTEYVKHTRQGSNYQTDTIKPLKGKELQVIWPHRFDDEKNPDAMLDIMDFVMFYHPTVKLVICTSRDKLYNPEPVSIKSSKLERMVSRYSDRIIIKKGIDKSVYYDLLAKSKIFLSTTLEENFGYCLVEAMSLGCHPIVVNDFSHPEIVQYNREFLYDTYDDAAFKILNALNEEEVDPVVYGYAKKYDKSAYKMVKIMEILNGNKFNYDECHSWLNEYVSPIPQLGRLEHNDVY